VAFIFSFSIQSLGFMAMLHLAMWGISLRFIKRTLQALGAKESSLLLVWNSILIATLLQMSTILRPILGESEFLFTPEKLFFIEH